MLTLIFKPKHLKIYHSHLLLFYACGVNKLTSQSLALIALIQKTTITLNIFVVAPPDNSIKTLYENKILLDNIVIICITQW